MQQGISQMGGSNIPMTAHKQIDDLSADHAGTHTPKLWHSPIPQTAHTNASGYRTTMTCEPCFPVVESHVTTSIEFGRLPWLPIVSVPTTSGMWREKHLAVLGRSTGGGCCLNFFFFDEHGGSQSCMGWAEL